MDSVNFSDSSLILYMVVVAKDATTCVMLAKQVTRRMHLSIMMESYKTSSPSMYFCTTDLSNWKEYSTEGNLNI